MSETGEPRLFTNGKVFTGQGVEDFAAAFSVADGRIAEVFDSAPADWEDGEVVDLAGRTVLPGLLDVHTPAARRGHPNIPFARVSTRSVASAARAT